MAEDESPESVPELGALFFRNPLVVRAGQSLVEAVEPLTYIFDFEQLELQLLSKSYNAIDELPFYYEFPRAPLEQLGDQLHNPFDQDDLWHW